LLNLSGDVWEDFVAALLQICGFYVEKNIEQPNILELDAVASLYEQNDSGGLPNPLQFSIQVKSGDWGMNEIFKQYGIMNFLKIPKGYFFAYQEPEERHQKLLTDYIPKMNIDLIYFSKLKSHKLFKSLKNNPNSDLLVDIWMRSYQIERDLSRVLKEQKQIFRNGKGDERLSSLMEYANLVKNALFFMSNEDKIKALFRTYKKNPNLSLELARAIGGDQNGKKIFQEALYEGKHDVLQLSFYVEHRARLALFKATVDHLCNGKEFDDQNTSSSILNAVTKMKRYSHFYKFPVLLQVFFWSWGGFFLDSKKEEETEVLAKEAQLPPEQVMAAFEVYDTLFPIGESWLRKVSNADYTVMRLIPMVFRGLGVERRIKFYGDLSSFCSGLTQSDLTRWHEKIKERENTTTTSVYGYFTSYLKSDASQQDSDDFIP